MHKFMLPVLLELLSEQGVSENQLLKNTGLTAIDFSTSSTLTSAQTLMICGNAVKLCNDSLLGVRAGLKLNMLSLGILGYALMSSATVGDSLRLLLRYKKAVLPSLHIECSPRQEKLELVGMAMHLPKNLERFYVDALFASVIHNIHVFTGNKAPSIALELTYDAPENVDLYHHIFGPTIQFNAQRCALIFDKQTLQMSISTSDPLVQSIFRRESDRLMASNIHSGIVSEHVKQILFLANLDFPTCATVAKRLHMSESTLQRKLTKEGVRYQQLLDQVRYKLALEYLQATALPVSEIAILLGFSDPANFRRSFKRWSHSTPSQVRHRQTQK